MPARKKLVLSEHFKVQVCSVCEELDLCFGEKQRNAPWFCLTCLRETLAWVQMSPLQRKVVEGIYRHYQTLPEVASEIAKLKEALTPELRAAMAQGEAKRRLVESDRSV